MPLRRPGKDESQQSYMSYCIRELSQEGAQDRSQEQKVAICMRMWRGGPSDGSATEQLADIMAKAGYQHTQPRHLDTGRFAGGDVYPTAFDQYHSCPKCGFRWSTRRVKP